MKIRITLVIVCFFAATLMASSATIIFKTDTEVSLKIKKPINGDFNFSYISDEFKLEPGVDISYKVEISPDDCVFVNCEFSIDKKFYVLLFENDIDTVFYSTDGISIKGDNAKGIQYINDNYVKNGSSHIYEMLTPIFQKHISDDYKINYDQLAIDLLELKTELVEKDLAVMKNAGQISAAAKKALSKYLDFCCLHYIFAYHENTLRKHRKQISREDYEEGKSQILKLYDDQELLKDAPKYRYAPALTDYYIHKFNWTGEKDSEKYNDPMYDHDTLGIYKALLIAPEHIQESLYGRFLVSQLVDQTRKNFDNEKMYIFLSKRFPYSPYLEVAHKLMKIAENKVDNANAVIITDAISSLKELVELKELKGGWIYIDLWATWCIPCKREFKYNEILHGLFKKYDNVRTVYLSIDEDKLHNIWVRNVKQIPLEGYNIRANQSLYKEIQTKVYNGESFGIPRYILLDSVGNIVNDNLPRPSQIKELEKVLDEILLK